MTDFYVNPISSQPATRGLFFEETALPCDKVFNNKTFLPSDSELFFKAVSKEFDKITDIATNVFSGIRSAHNVVDPKRILFPKRIANILFFTSAADFLLFPSSVVAPIKDLLCLFTLKGILARVDALLLFITDTTDLVRNSATLFSVLHEVRIVSEAAIRWIYKFYVVAFFVDFIELGRSYGSCRHMLSLVGELLHDLNTLNAENVLEKKEETARSILRKLHEQKEALTNDLVLSKKALQKRIDTLTKFLIEKDAKAFEHTNAFIETLYHRAKVQSNLVVIDLVNSVVTSGGAFMAFFPPLSIAATMVMGATGIVSFVTWGVTTHALSKNPFGGDIQPSVPLSPQG